MKYFIFTSGPRGCHLPDTCETYAFETRRELKDFLLETAGRDDGDNQCVGLSIRAIAWMAAHAWRKGSTGAILPYGFKGQGKPYCYTLYPIDRREYLSRLKSEGE